MALIKCKECGREISSTVKTCTYCGYNNKYRKTKKTFGILSIIFLIIYLFFSRVVFLNIIFGSFAILSLIFSIISISKEKPKIIGIIGLILTIIGIFMAVTYYYEPILSEDELIKEANILDWPSVYSTVQENGAKAEDYEGKYYVYQGKVNAIEDNYCELADYVVSSSIDVYLSTEDLKKLKIDDEITVIGKLNNVNDLPELDSAILLDDTTIKDNYVLALRETTASGKYAENYENTYYNYKYDKKTYLIKSYSAQGKGNENGDNTLTYDKKGNLIKHERATTLYGTDVQEYEYDKEGNVIKETEYTNNNGEIKNQKIFNNTYEKDDNNKVTKKISINSESGYTMIYTYEYDKNGNLIKENQTSDNSSYEITYEYDNFGNMITKKTTNTEKTSSWVTLYYRYGIIGKKR